MNAPLQQLLDRADKPGPARQVQRVRLLRELDDQQDLQAYLTHQPDQADLAARHCPAAPHLVSRFIGPSPSAGSLMQLINNPALPEHQQAQHQILEQLEAWRQERKAPDAEGYTYLRELWLQYCEKGFVIPNSLLEVMLEDFLNHQPELGRRQLNGCISWEVLVHNAKLDEDQVGQMARKGLEVWNWGVLRGLNTHPAMTDQVRRNMFQWARQRADEEENAHGDPRHVDLLFNVFGYHESGRFSRQTPWIREKLMEARDSDHIIQMIPYARAEELPGLIENLCKDEGPAWALSRLEQIHEHSELGPYDTPLLERIPSRGWAVLLGQDDPETRARALRHARQLGRMPESATTTPETEQPRTR